MEAKKLICAIDTSSLSWLERIGYLDLLLEIYESIFASPGVLEQIKTHYPTQDFISRNVKTIKFDTETDRKLFYDLVKEWHERTGIKDPVDAEVFSAYKFIKADEALYANRKARRVFKKYGNARDIYQLYEHAEILDLFSRSDSLKFLEKLTDYGYAGEDLETIINSLKSDQ